MTKNRLPLNLVAVTFSIALAALGQGQKSRILTATLPVPLPSSAEHPLSPDKLRTESPWTRSLAGDWRFKLTHGQIVNGHFTLSNDETTGLKSSSTQSGNSAGNAFDGSPDTRWCANGTSFPQWLQAKVDGVSRSIVKVEIAWERPEAHYRYRVEGSEDCQHWRTLADRSKEPGFGDESLTVSGTARFVRVVVLGASGGSWASIRELKIHYLKGNTDTVWHPVPPSSTTPPHSDDFTKTSFDDGKWDHLAVPSNWEMAGYSIPTYDSVDDTVGLYRRWVDVPAAWLGQRIVWRFDGALDGAEIYVNGKRAGYHESGYTAFDVDLTGLLRPGEKNLLAVRVCKTTPSSECETGDYQCMGGIYRDTRLIAVPETHVSDLTVRTPLSGNYHDATLQVGARVDGAAGESVKVSGYVTDAATGHRLPVSLSREGTVGKDGSLLLALSAAVSGPKLWSAEKPSLYYVTLDLSRGGKPVERVEQRFGFRQVEIKNQIVLWNGQPIKCTGICRHDFWPDKGFALTDAQWSKDLTLMKATNINAIRTSHYNHAARFLELCEERGFYILDEVPFCWVGDLVKDPKFAPPLLQRAAETVARDKNRPCVLAWSLGNENPVGVDTQQVHDLVHHLDPTRPSFASGAGPNDVKGQEVFDTHYPSPGGLNDYLTRNAKVAPIVITEHPHTFYSRETQTYDPGASDTWSEGLIATWDLLRRNPTMLGSFIWEWQSQGIADHFPDHTTDFYYGLDHMRQENNKGIMDAYRNPKPEQWIVKMVYSPVQFLTRQVKPVSGGYSVRVANHYTFTDLNELAIHWTALKNKTVLARGVAHISCAPGQTVDASVAAPAGLTSLEFEVDRPDGTNVTLAKLDAPNVKPASAPAPLGDGGALSVKEDADTLQVDNQSQHVVIDKQTGTVRKWVVGGHDRLRNGGPYLNLGEASTAAGDHYYRATRSPVEDDATVATQTEGDGSVHVTTRSHVHSGSGSKEELGMLTVEYTIRPKAEMLVRWQFEWTAGDTNLWEIGLCVPLPTGIERETWSHDSYFTAYPDGNIGAPTGVCSPSDVAFRSSKRSLRYLTLSNKEGIGLALIASGSPLIGRARSDAKGTVLFASREVAAAGPDDLSFSWFHAHDIHAQKGKALSGEFLLRAIDGRG